MTDKFDRSGLRENATIAPIENSELVDVSSADHEFTNPTRAILATGAGTLTVRLTGDAADLALTVTAGTFLPLRVSHVRRGSTATAVGFW